MAIDSQEGDDRRCLGRLLVAWQSSGDHVQLAVLLSAARPLIERTVWRTLRRHHVCDPAAIDDSVSRVFDHLRRLPGGTQGESLVANFVPRMTATQDNDADGHGYVVWLARARAVDVVRARRRRIHCFRLFSELPQARLSDATGRAATPVMDDESGAAGAPPGAAAGQRLHAVLPRLEPRQRSVVERLLAGESQAAIARVLGVCEGTVSRLRSKAIVSLRRLLND